MSNKLVVSDYDFEAVNSNLKSFLQGQTSADIFSIKESLFKI